MGHWVDALPSLWFWLMARQHVVLGLLGRWFCGVEDWCAWIAWLRLMRDGPGGLGAVLGGERIVLLVNVFSRVLRVAVGV